ncbi:hypothetical protein NM688_g1922 [Phlebia brevispora]|uniref:Uncharacterized protein n=1 Tax=Phlebia brevispora TaxID=194682 RepID=A0ACC1T9Y6_9APHY|nr:hypothetical protein NM688_g1922 [Phlebia brevispora]
MNSKLSVTLCIVLHAILAFIYAAIFATYEAGVYNRPLHFSPSLVRTVLSVVSQAFTITYCAILVLLTQRITLHDLINKPQTLSAIHDKSSAWLGLGSSLQTLARQATLVTDFLSVSMITAYLLLIFVVHTTLPGIFGVATVNVTVSSTYPTTLAYQPNTFNALFTETFWTVNNLQSILEVYDILNLTTIGVSDNVLYDIIPDVENAADGGVDVNATTVSVDCNTLSDASQWYFISNTSYVNWGVGTYPSKPEEAYVFRFGGDNYSVVVYPIGECFMSDICQRSAIDACETAPGELQVLTVDTVGANGDELRPTLIVASASPLVDSAGRNATTVDINPPWSEASTSGADLTTSISLLACDFKVRNSTVTVDPHSRTISQSPTHPAPAQWHDWVDPGRSPDSLLLNLPEFATAPSSPQVYSLPKLLLSNSTYNATTLPQLSLIDWFLHVDILASRNANLTASLEPVTLEELNWSLGRAYTAVLWYYNSAMSPGLAFNETDSDRLQGQVSVPSSILQERLTVNVVPLFVGLGASCVLFVAAVILIARSGALEKDVAHHDVSGLLPILWLLGNEPRIAAIERPDVDALRYAGMYEVLGTHKLRRRTSITKGGTDGYTGEEYELRYPFSTRPSDPLLIRTENALSDRTALYRS